MSPFFAAIVVIIGGLLLFGLWNVINTHNATNSRRKRQRKSDRVKLTRQQQQVYQEAIRHYKAGKLKSSARMLESLNMTREAINILEKGRHIHEAASILLRIHRPNRAGIMYSRHGMWKEAAECFKKAGLPLEVAKSSKMAGDLATAVVYFTEAKEYLQAAECYEELGKHREAARLYTKLKKHKKAIQQYKYLLDKNPHIESIDFSEKEVDVIIQYIASESTDTRLADVLVIKERVVEVICKLIKSNRLEKAFKIFMKSATNIGPALIGYDGFSREENLRLGEIFTKASAYEYAGMIYERLEEFALAGDSFRKQEDFERAAYCYDRAQLHDKVTEMRIEIASRGPSAKKSDSIPHRDHQDEPDRFKIEPTAADFHSHESTAELPDQHELEKTLPPESVPAPDMAINNASSPPQLSLSMADEETDHGEATKEMPMIPPTTPVGFHELSQDVNWNGLHEAAFLQDLTTEQQESFKSIGTVKEFDEGSVILDYQDEPVGLYFILSGNVQVNKLLDGVDTRIDSMGPSETIGKLWLFIDRPTNVKFQAATPCVLFAVKRGDFMDMLDKDGTLARKIYKRFTMSLLDKLLNTDNYSDNLEAS